MSKYRVVYAMSYDVEAEDESDAEDKAAILFAEDGIKDTTGFGCNIEEVD